MRLSSSSTAVAQPQLGADQLTRLIAIGERLTIASDLHALDSSDLASSFPLNAGPNLVTHLDTVLTATVTEAQLSLLTGSGPDRDEPISTLVLGLLLDGHHLALELVVFRCRKNWRGGQSHEYRCNRDGLSFEFHGSLLFLE